MRRLAAMLALAVLTAWMLGCGGEAAFVQGSAPPPTAEGLTQVRPGTGPVRSAAVADQRILSEYLGLSRARSEPLALLGPDPAVLGQPGDPVVEVIRVPSAAGLEAPVPAGTRLNRPSRPTEQVLATTRWPAWLYAVDTVPGADMGHRVLLVLVRSEDGAIFELASDWAPGLDDQFPLSRGLGDIIYLHLFFAQQDQPTVRAARARTVEGATPVPDVPGEVQVVGLGVSGDQKGLDGKSDRLGVREDLDAAKNLHGMMGGGGPGNPWLEAVDFVDELDSDRMSADKLREALCKAGGGLGPEDKLFLFISSHGLDQSLGIHGLLAMGDDYPVTWEELCQMLDEEVTAGEICLILSTCYAGAAIVEFENWKLKGKRLRFVGCADGSGVGVQTVNGRCVLKAIEDEIRARAGSGPVTPELVGSVLSDPSVVANLTEAELTKKYCALLEGQGVSQHGLTPAQSKAAADEFKARKPIKIGVPVVTTLGGVPGPSPSPSPSLSPSPSPSLSPSPPPIASPSPPVAPSPVVVKVLYTTSGNSTVRLDSSAQGDAPRQSVGGPATGLATPLGLALDAGRDQLYVANLANSVISVFSPAHSVSGNVAPVRSLTGLAAPVAVLYDASNDRLYVTTNSPSPRVAVLDRASTRNGSVVADRTLSGISGLAAGLALDPQQDRLFISVQGSGIDVVDNASRANGARASVVNRTITSPGLVNVRGLFFDAGRQRLYVADAGQVSLAGRVLVFAQAGSASGATTPVQELTGTRSGIGNPFGVFVDLVADELFVTNLLNGTVTIHANAGRVSGDAPPARSITGLDAPQGLLLGPKQP